MYKGGRPLISTTCSACNHSAPSEYSTLAIPNRLITHPPLTPCVFRRTVFACGLGNANTYHVGWGVIAGAFYFLGLVQHDVLWSSKANSEAVALRWVISAEGRRGAADVMPNPASAIHHHQRVPGGKRVAYVHTLAGTCPDCASRMTIGVRRLLTKLSYLRP